MTVTSAIIPGMAGAPPIVIVPPFHPTLLGTVLSLFDESGTWFWILVGAMIVFLALLYAIPELQEVTKWN
jgi:hypothetical protein